MNIASIDIGSNSVILLIAEVDIPQKRFTPLRNYYLTPRISRNLAQTGAFDAGSIARLKGALNEFKGCLSGYNVKTVLTVGTEAFRKASNSDSVIADIQNDTGIEIKILSGHEEGVLTYLGATSIAGSFSGYVIDIGGGSTEIIFGENGKVTHSRSFKFGTVRLHETLHTSPPISKDKILKIRETVKTFFAGFVPESGNNFPAIAVSGAPTSLVCMDIGIKEFDERKIEGYNLNREAINRLADLMSRKSSAEILKEYGAIVQGTSDIMLTGAVILDTIMEILKLESVSVSTRGLRHGVILNYIDPVI